MRTLRVIVAVVLLLTLVFPGAAPQAATAHSGVEHATADRANVPISQIERETAANKVRIMQNTGVEPGAARSTQQGASPATMAAVSADPGQSGTWSSVINTQVVPVFQAILPNGKVLVWDSIGDAPAETLPIHNFTRAMVWNPANNTFKRVDVQGYNIFCAGFAHLPNGNILVAGGNADQTLAGIVQTHIFNWQTETWSRGTNMASARWYPSVAAMANGEQTIIGGGPATAEVYQTNGAIRALSGFTNTTYGSRKYPFMISRSDTQLGILGPYNDIFTLITAGSGVITASGIRDGINREYGSFATYGISRTLIAGGAYLANGAATKTAVVVAKAGLGAKVIPTGDMSFGRRQFNATVLADGSVLATGGMSKGGYLVDLNNAVTSAERWDPSTGAWNVLASASRIRQYHSTANLLPDGRVITGGGGICGDCTSAGYLEKNIEYFTPPYLYKNDGSGELAVRPTITTAPSSVGINTNFSVVVSPIGDIQKVVLVGLGDATHGVDQGQRYIPLKFKRELVKTPGYSATNLDITGPPNSGVAPPGYYMLFVINADGVPSVAKIVQVGKGPNPLMSTVKNTGAARCIDVPQASLAIRTYLQSYTCNGSKAQALSRLPNDQTLRVLGNCIDVPHANYVSHQKIWVYTCNGSDAQKWQFGSDGTIRPIAATKKCLTAASYDQKADLTLTNCSDHPRQKWAW